jgi:thermostable 8-oxoguanine DNA glycosylase
MIISRDDLEPNDWNYDYLPKITPMLDSYDGDFNQVTVNKIVLWKVNRYPIIDDTILEEINGIKKTDDKISSVAVKTLILKLLSCHGIQLPMASTILRFKNPKLFQIIDQRVYRVIYGKKMKLPGSYNISNREKLADLYLQYLKDLRNKCDELNIPFEKADRILWMADKRINKDKRLDNY